MNRERAVAASTWLVVAAAVCFGTTGTAQALGAPGASAGSLGSARIVLGGGLLALLALVSSRGSRAGVRRMASGGRSGRIVLVCAGALGVAAYQPAFFLGTGENGVAVGTLVALGSAPALTGLLEWLVLRRRPSGRWIIATAVAAAGVLVLSGALSGDGGSLTALGLAASLAAGASYAVYTLSSKALLDRGWDPATTMGTTFGVAALALLPVLLTSDVTWLVEPSGLATAVWLAVITTAVAYTLFAQGLQSLPAARVATITLLEPVTATILGILVLHESFTLSTVVGVSLLLAGLVILTTGRRKLMAVA
ncbi:hypothetical protein JF66_03475 [Cryobacterium sp. MLB-32]|uniref:DMT family transporter n=1 Tax=Cryobacterium sp. MLB-32 TaxID=1529318 RepID=UPI0004E70A37|nr:DMT family transporter [Cryobacterium sp. MLB-32]KFF60644.1 hypothetical protein JF66_03475 [Cryobacterium sp. MLB-32]